MLTGMLSIICSLRMQCSIRPNVLVGGKNSRKGIDDLRERGRSFFRPILERRARLIAGSAIGNEVTVMKTWRGADFDGRAGLLPKLGNGRHQLDHPFPTK